MAHTMARIIAMRTGMQVVAVGSKCTERARAFAESCGVGTHYGDYESLLARPDVEAVYIANATHDHAAAAMAALRANKAVLCEKPLATCSADAEAVVAAARQASQLLMEGIWTLCLPSYRCAMQRVADRSWGDPVSFCADFGYPVAIDGVNDRFLVQSGGVLLDRAVYVIALATKLFGEVQTVDARLKFVPSGIDTHASLFLQHETGVHSVLIASFLTQLANRATISCQQGMMQLQSPLLGCEEVFSQSTRPAKMLHHAPTALSLKNRLVGRLREMSCVRRINRNWLAGKREQLPFGRNGYLPMLHHFSELVQQRRLESDLVPLELSLSVQRTIELARRRAAGDVAGSGSGS